MQHKHNNEKSYQDLQEEVYALQKLTHPLCDALQVQDSLKRAADAHCTIMKQAVSDLRVQLNNMKKKANCGSTKVKARFLTLPQLKDSFEVEEVERAERQHVTADKDAQKTAEEAERKARIQEEASVKTFEFLLNLYKRKDDLHTIARALKLSDSKLKVADLTENIWIHLEEHPELRENPWFSSLFANKCQRTSQNQPHSAPDDDSCWRHHLQHLEVFMDQFSIPSGYHPFTYWNRPNRECK